MIPRKGPVTGYVCVSLLSLLCLGTGRAEPKSLDFQTIEQGLRSGIQVPRTVLIRNESAWKNLWIEHERGLSTAPAAPVMDFSKEMVIAVFLGMRRTGGYSVAIKDISVRQPDAPIWVSFEEVKPGKGCMVTQVLTSPFQIVRLARVEGPVTFNLALKVNDCSSR